MPPTVRTTVCEATTGSQLRAPGKRFDSLRILLPGRVSSGHGERDVGVSEASSNQADHLCLSPLSQFFMSMPAAPDIYAVMEMRGYCTIPDIVEPMNKFASMHDRFRRRVVYGFGAWHAEVLDDFDVTLMMRDVTLAGPDAQLAFNNFTSQLMSGPPLGEGGYPPWDIYLIHYECSPNRTDLLLRASHVIGDGQLFMGLIKAVLDEDPSAPSLADKHQAREQQHQAKQQQQLDNLDFELISSEDKIPVGTLPKRVGAAVGLTSAATTSSRGHSDMGMSSLDSPKAGHGSSGSSSSGGSMRSSSSGGSLDSAAEAAGGGLEGGREAAAAGAGDEAAVLDQQQQDKQQYKPESWQSEEGQGCRVGRGQGQGTGAEHVVQQQHRQGPGKKGRSKRKSWWKVFWSLLVQIWNAYTALIYTMWCPLLPADPVSGIKACSSECTGPRHWSSVTFPLAEFKAVSKSLGVSINALAVTCLSGGIARYNKAPAVGAARSSSCKSSISSSSSSWLAGLMPFLLRWFPRTPAERVKSIRMCSMVDTRAMAGQLTGMSMENSNNFSFIGVPICTGPGFSSRERLRKNAAALSWIRHSLAVPLAIRIPSVVQFFVRVPSWSVAVILYCLPRKASIGFSNMKGPDRPLSLSGFPVTKIYNGVQPNAFGMFVSLFSYNDVVTFTNTCYATKSTHPEQLLECIKQEYEALRELAREGGERKVSAAPAAAAAGPAEAAAERPKHE